MEIGPHKPAPAGLSVLGQLYVVAVALVAAVSLWSDAGFWHPALVVLALPLSLLALWVSFYARVTVAVVFGDDPTGSSWAVAVVWVAIWTLTAWINAQVIQKLVRSGWRAVAARPAEEPEESEDYY